MEEGRRGGCNGVVGRRGFPATGWGEGGLAFPARGVGSSRQISAPASLKSCRICQNHCLSPNFFAFFPATMSLAAFMGKMLCTVFNSVGFNWLACSMATKLEMGSSGQKREGFQRGGSSRGRKVRGVGGFSGVAGVLLTGTTIVGGKKKFNRTIPSELFYWSDSSIGPPV